MSDRHKILKPYIENKSVLHIGCVDHHWRSSLKENWMHNFIVKHAEKTKGLDILPNDVQKLNDLGYNIVCANAENFDLNEKFDVIFVGEIMEHLEDYRSFLRNCKKHMTANSRIIITTPNSFGARYVIMNLLNKQHVNSEHVCWFDKVTLTQLLNRNGFEVETTKYIGLDKDYSGKIKGLLLRQIERLPQSKPVLFVVAKIKMT